MRFYWLLLLLLSMSSPARDMDRAGLFAPAQPGDGQTATWRIINKDEAGKNPWTAIGNFLIPGLGGYCSAVLVAPRIVLTANHCLYALDYSARDDRGNPSWKRLDATRFVFVAGLHDSFFADLIPVEEVITGGWQPGSGDTAKDWVIAVLKRPAAASILPMAFGPYDSKAVAAAWTNRLVLAAYPSASFAFSAVLRFAFDCSILHSSTPGTVSHDCPSEGGSSGGPILVNEGGTLRLIGIHSNAASAISSRKTGVSINGFLPSLAAAVARYESPSPLGPAAMLQSLR